MFVICSSRLPPGRWHYMHLTSPPWLKWQTTRSSKKCTYQQSVCTTHNAQPKAGLALLYFYQRFFARQDWTVWRVCVWFFDHRYGCVRMWRGRVRRCWGCRLWWWWRRWTIFYNSKNSDKPWNEKTKSSIQQCYMQKNLWKATSGVKSNLWARTSEEKPPLRIDHFSMHPRQSLLLDLTIM